MTYANANRLLLLLFSLCLTAGEQLHAAEPVKSKEQSFFESAATGKPEGRQFAQKPEDPLALSAADDSFAYQVRCWQQGILILDELNWRTPQIQTRFAAMKPVGGASSGLYLLDMGAAFCQFKRQ